MITFRGFRVDGGGWVEGQHNFQEETHFITINFDFCDDEGLGYARTLEVYPESLGIADTNIKDKNDHIIFASFEYEEGKMSIGGDIVTYNEQNWVVIMQHAVAGLKFKNIFTFLMSCDIERVKIIGDIYENPELLEVN